MAVFVLVHGSWTGGWAWDRVAPLLERAGHTVLAPSLTGPDGPDRPAGPGTGLLRHIDEVCGLVEHRGLRDVHLVGHSYGGMVVTGVARRLPGRVRRLVYLDGFWPEPGQSAFDLQPWLRDAFVAGSDRGGSPGLVPPLDFTELGVREEADLEWLRPRLAPMALDTHTEALPATLAGPRPPVSYVRFGGFPVFAGAAEEAVRRGADVRVLEGVGHMAPVTDPDAVAGALLRIAEPPVERATLERVLTERAWTDPGFAELLQEDPVRALAGLGVAVPEGMRLDVRMQRSDTLYYVIPPLADGCGLPGTGVVEQMDLWRSGELFCWILPQARKVDLLAMRQQFRHGSGTSSEEE